MTKSDTAIRAQLLALKNDLETQSAETAENRSAVQLDQQSVGRLSRMDAMQQQEMSKAQEASRQRDLLRIEQALRRLDAGEYGECGSCGNPLPEGRLAIDPMAETCVACAQ